MDGDFEVDRFRNMAGVLNICMLSRSLRFTLPLFLMMEMNFLPLVNCRVLRFAALRTIEAQRKTCRTAAQFERIACPDALSQKNIFLFIFM